MRRQIIIAIALALGVCSCSNDPLDNEYNKETISEDMKSMSEEERSEIYKGIFISLFSGKDLEKMTYRDIIEFRKEKIEHSKP